MDNDIHIQNAFLKWFIQPDSWVRIMKNIFEIHNKHHSYNGIFETQVEDMHTNTEQYLLTLLGLRYEHRFYMTVIKYILDNKLSPHFVRVFGNLTRTCTGQNLEKLLEHSDIPEYDIKTHLLRNLLYLLLDMPGRPAINEFVRTNDRDIITYIIRFSDIFRNINEINIGYIMTQYLSPPQSQTFANFVLINNNDTKESKRNMTLILFQIVQACYCLYLKNATHNDLHAGNVFVTTRPEHGLAIKYILPDGKLFEFKNVIHCARLFDFDRSYAMELGNNEALSMIEDNGHSLCSDFHQCNRTIKGKDIAQILCFISDYPAHQYLMPLITDMKTGKYTDTWKAVFKSNCFFEPDIIDKQTGKMFHLNDEVFSSIYDYPVILQNLYDLYLDTVPINSQKWLDNEVGHVYKLT